MSAMDLFRDETPEQHEVRRQRVMAERVAQGLTPLGSDPVRLEQTAAIIRASMLRRKANEINAAPKGAA